jgi:hypothetical protein
VLDVRSNVKVVSLPTRQSRLPVVCSCAPPVNSKVVLYILPTSWKLASTSLGIHVAIARTWKGILIPGANMGSGKDSNSADIPEPKALVRDLAVAKDLLSHAPRVT